MKIEIEQKDLEWIAHTLHNAYHQPPEGKGGLWKECKKSICSFIYDTIFKMEPTTTDRRKPE